MKKITAIVLSAVLCLSLTACSDKGDNITSTVTEPSDSTSTTESLIDTPEIMGSTEITDEGSEGAKSKMIITGTPDSLQKSGFAPIKKITYTVSDPENTKGLSTEKLSHSHGPASGGKAHYTVEEFQRSFEKYGALTLDTSGEKTVYLTFDCGYEYEGLTGEILDVLKEKKVTAAFFCTLDHIKSEPELISRMIKEGHIVGNHSATHPSFAEISRSEMVREIEETENCLRESFGYAAKYFRFPAGEYNESALDLVQSLGYVSVFWSLAYDDWDTAKVRGKDYATEKVMSRLHPGAVILLHSVSRDNAQALPEIIDEIRAQGYSFESLVNYG